MLDINFEKRKKVLSMSLSLENMTSAFLSKLLGIVNHKETISFGNKSSSLSFSHKISLLIDIGALPAEQRNKFLTFMEIRNQFVHNIEAKDYESCYSFLKGKETFILREYPQDKELNKEEQLENATMDLCIELGKITIEILERIKVKVEQDVKADMYDKMLPILIDTIASLSEKK